MSNPTDPQRENEKTQLELQKLGLEIGEMKRPLIWRWFIDHGFKDLISLIVAFTGIFILWSAGLFDTRRERLSVQEERLKIQDLEQRRVEAAIQEKQTKLNQLELSYNLLETERAALREIANERRHRISAQVGLGTDVESFRIEFRHLSFLMAGPAEIHKDNRLVELLKLTQTIRHLEALSVVDLEVGDAEINEIAKLRTLKKLELVNTNLSDATITKLGLHSGLTELRLDRNPITTLREINRFGGLTLLSLRRTKIDDAALRDATTLKRCVTALHLDSTEITDASVRELLSWNALDYLGIKNTKITSEGLVRLSEHPKLHVVNVEPERLAAQDAETLKSRDRLSRFFSVQLPDDFD